MSGIKPRLEEASAPASFSRDIPAGGEADASSPDPRGAAGTPLSEARKLLARSRLFGRLSACIFLLAALAVVDALQTLVRHEFNTLDIVAGETMLVSGMLPADAKSHDDLEVSIEGAPGVSFTPVETYKGFWMGGHMWRAELSAEPGTPPGKVVITITDIIPPPKDAPATYDDRDRSILYGGQQNPALVFGLSVWPSEKERRAADSSLFRRYTGFPAFGVAVAAVVLALLCGIANWRIFARAESALAAHDVFFIHGLKDLPAGGQALSGYKAAFARAGRPLTRGQEVLLLDRDWREHGRGHIVETDAVKGYALFPHGGTRPKYGWLVMRAAADGAL